MVKVCLIVFHFGAPCIPLLSPQTRINAESAIKFDLAEEVDPFLNDLSAPRLDDVHYIAQDSLRYLRIVVLRDTASGFCYPNLCCASARRSLGDVNVDWFKRVIFVCPEIHPIRANLKNLRHFLSLPLWQSEG